MMMDGMMMNNSIIMMMCFGMFVGMLIFIAALGITTFWVIRLLMRKSRVEDYPLMILKERLAKGEISEEEYRQTRNMLNQDK